MIRKITLHLDDTVAQSKSSTGGKNSSKFMNLKVKN